MPLPPSVLIQCCTFIQEYMPLPPSEEGEQPKLEFSVVECLIFSFHQLVKGRHIDFLTADENADRLKDFRQRLVNKCKSKICVSNLQTFWAAIVVTTLKLLKWYHKSHTYS